MRRNQKFPNRSRSKLFFPRKGIQTVNNRLTKHSPIRRKTMPTKASLLLIPSRNQSEWEKEKEKSQSSTKTLSLSLDHRSFTALNGWNFETLEENPDGNRIHRAKNDPRNAYVYVLLLDRPNNLWCESYRSGGSIETRKRKRKNWGGGWKREREKESWHPGHAGSRLRSS